MKKNYFFIILYIFFVSACTAGLSRQNKDNLYGDLLEFQQITLNGNVSQESISTKYMQQNISDAICPNINESLPLFGLVDYSAESLCNENINYIASESNLFKNINLTNFIESNDFNIKSVNLFRISYTTQGQSIISNNVGDFKENVSGLIALPIMNDYSKIKGIVLYYHPTVFSKNNVPSMQDYKSQLLLSALYASQGYILIAPDYVGQGINIKAMHPYVLYAKNNALSGLNMLKATRQFLNQNKLINESNLLNLYITSYSEGGSYALWASRLISADYNFIANDNHVNLKKTIAIEGAYDLSGTMLPFAYQKIINAESIALNPYRASPGISGSSNYKINILPIQKTLANFNMSSSKIALTSYAFSAFINYSYNGTGYNLLFNSDDFLYIRKCLDLKSYLDVTQKPVQGLPISDCKISGFMPDLFMNPDYNEDQIQSILVSSAMGSTNYFTDSESISVQLGKIANNQAINNSVISIAKSVENDPYIMSLIKEADTWSYKATTPTVLIYLNYDSVVTSLNSIKSCEDINGVKALSGDKVQCLMVDATKLYYAILPPTSSNIGQIPMMLDHSAAAGILQLIALQQINK
jgi:hypothetical protein